MKKQIISLALALALSAGLAVPALGANGGGGWTFVPVGQSLDQPAPLPAHLEEQGNSDWWLIYDFDHSKVLEITRDEWDERVYTVLEGMEFTVWPNPNWRGTVNEMSIRIQEDYSDPHYFYNAPEPTSVEDMRYMPPTTITFGHNVAMPDGTVADLAEMGKTYTLEFNVCWDEDGTLPFSYLSENFRVIPAIAYASTQTVDIDGKAVEFQMYAIKDANGNDTNYVKVRDVALALNGTAAQFNVGWDGNVNLEKGKAYTTRNGQENNTPYSGDQPFTCATSATNVDGESAGLTAFVITDASGNGSTYYKLRDLGDALGFTVDWSAQRGIYIETK